VTRCKPKRQLELLHHGPINLKSYTPGRQPPYSNKASAVNSRRGTNANHWSRSLYVGTSPHPPPPTALSGTQISEVSIRASLPPSHHRGQHRTKRANSRTLAPMDPPHLPANTNQAHLPCRCARATPPTNRCHYLTKTGLRCDASKKGMTPIAPLSHV
jgi:hypothetical protein